MPIAIPFDDGGTAVLVPTFAPDGSALDEPAAIEQYKKSGKHFGKFDTPDNARAYAEQLTQQYAQPPTAPAPAEPAAPGTSVPAGRRRVGSVVPPEAPPPTAPEPAVPGPPPLMSLEQHLAGVSKINPFTGQPATPSQLDAAIALARADHGRMMAATEESRARLKNTLANGAASLADGRPFNWNEAEVRSLIPQPDADKVIGVMRDSEKAGQYIGSIRLSTPEINEQHRAELLAGLSDPQAPDYEHRKKLLTIFETKLQEQQKERDEDAAMYAYRYMPGIADKLQAAFAEQNRPQPPGATAVNPKIAETWDDYVQSTKAVQRYLGVPEDKQRILPVKMAQQEAQRIAALDPEKTNPATYVRALAAKYGAGQGAYDHWPQVFGELVKAKLPGEYQVLANMDRPDQAVAADDLSRALTVIAKKGGAEAVKTSVPDQKRKDIDKAIDDQLENFRLSVYRQPGGEELYKTVESAARTLSYYYGAGPKDATKSVTDAVNGIINNKYDFGELGADMVRVPKGKLSEVSNAADRIKEDILANPSDVPPILGNALMRPAERQAIWMDAIRNGGWVNNNDDSGLVLAARTRDGSLKAVHRADGSRVVLKFTDAPAYAAGPGPTELPSRTAVPQVTEPAAAGPRLPGNIRSPAPTGTVPLGIR